MENVKRPSDTLIKCATNVFLAMAYRESILAIVTDLQQQVLQERAFNVTDSGQRIHQDNLTFMLDDNEFNIYLSNLHQRYLAAGFQVAFGECPLDGAHFLLRQTRKKLIDASKELNLPHDIQLINRSEKFISAYVEILLRFLVPFVNATLK
ncbi:MAG: hypothetical protein P4L51_23805 [Puia sp.]|nr:hypothetical protein [Puia sp.]